MRKGFALILLIVSVSLAASAQDEILTKAEAIKVEAKLKQNPADFNTRMRLIWFYQFKESAADKAALQRLRLDCVRFTPEHAPSAFSCSGLWTADDVKKPDYVQIRNEWLRQIGLHKTEKTVLMNAFGFFVDSEPEIAEKILNDGKNLEPFDPEFTNVQITNDKGNLSFYNNMVGIEEDATLNPKIDLALKKIVASVKDGVERIDKKTEKTEEDLDYRSAFLAEGASAAFDLEDFKDASEMAELLLKSLSDVNKGLSEYRNVKYFQIGMSVIGRIELRKGNVEKAREYLLNSLKLIAEDLTEAAGLDGKFLSEFLVVDGRRSVLEYLSILEKYQADSEDWKEFFVRFKSELAKGKNPNFDQTLLALY